MQAQLSYVQAIIMGVIQGATELFPISSLGHAVIIPALVPGWEQMHRAQASTESWFLAFLVGLHVGTAIALLLYYRRTWVQITGAFVSSVRRREVSSPTQRLAWLIVLGTIPVGIVGLAFEHKLRVVFAKPLAASVFLTLNGLLLLGGEVLRRRSLARSSPKAAVGDRDVAPRYLLDSLPFGQGILIGASQIAALFAGISRSGVSMVAGLTRGLDHEDAARFSFLLATPVILLAGVYKLPDLLGPLGAAAGRSQVVVGSIAAGVTSYLSVRFLVRWFETKTLWPFGIYCLVAGAACSVYFVLFPA